MARQRTIALCDESAAKQFAPWSQAYENAATDAWRAVMRLTPEAARQERQAIAEMIERLEWLKESNNDTRGI